jgi:hypothetical protein
MDTILRLRKTFALLFALSVGLSLFTALQSHMNNWLIFRASFDHLLAGTSLYIPYPNEHHDLYKYSPTFALLMAPLSILPPWLGGTLWNLLGAGLFGLALVRLPVTDKQRQTVFWVSLPEFIGSTQGFQSNVHMVSLLMLFWVSIEQEKPIQGATALVSSVFIKIFGVLGGCLFVFSHWSGARPQIFLRNLSVVALVSLLFFFLPTFIVGWDSLLFQYQEWGRLLQMDAAQSYGFSLRGVIHGFTGWDIHRLPLQLAGAASLLLAFWLGRDGDRSVRLLGVIALCYFMVVFNHKSESPTFIIPMMGFGLHLSYLTHRRTRWGLLLFTLGCVSLLYSDLFRELKKPLFDVYCVKVWPFLILSPICLWQIARSQPRRTTT